MTLHPVTVHSVTSKIAAVQRVTTFSAGVAVKAKAPDAAKALIEFLMSPAAAPAITKTGLEPVAASEHAHQGRLSQATGHT